MKKGWFWKFSMPSVIELNVCTSSVVASTDISLWYFMMLSILHTMSKSNFPLQFPLQHWYSYYVFKKWKYISCQSHVPKSPFYSVLQKVWANLNMGNPNVESTHKIFLGFIFQRCHDKQCLVGFGTNFESKPFSHVC